MTRARAWRDGMLAVRAAWLAPREIARSLPSLLELRGAPGHGAAPDPQRVAHALRHARRALALLSRVPGARWRTTCLYRSAAECLVLRAMGVPVRVVIGVDASRGTGATNAAAPGGDTAIRAHAWVAGADDAPPGEFAVLTGGRARGDAFR